ncbi:mitochondrial inner membrane protease subunit 1-like [Papaver somniferum]|uniref:mitochondrial inner membrane protease subunit 1-like n=1 Tax=Papaver somniferum TaxID=3469 RepID=UPI000E6FBEC6|nr:mitochondrial inner membrane protease subunit 1-like [Papaver somniferum]XP_026439835.1 mitochondrial inner membrane protease subunit 1-like [Papaver somniferum]XP_026439836.1 mitochondrial inner membrane protease subunit 1-like [Papaver somniferum]XP_026439837.1 mitochondrial inner membrane protease subunit 1-like [Papaver somniferum]
MNGLRNLLKGKGLEIAKEAIDRTFLVGKLLCFLHVTNTYICSPALVYGPSMLPTFSLTGDLVFGEKISPRLGKVNNGDIVLVRSPENPKKTINKRILGMEGNHVTYLIDPQNSEKCRTITVPKGHIWIQGDNIYDSQDSRQFGPVPYGLIQSKVFCRVKQDR